MREDASVRHTLMRWTLGGGLFTLGVWREPGANFPAPSTVLLILGAFLALSLSRASERT